MTTYNIICMLAFLLYVSWKEVIPRLARRGENRTTGHWASCQAADMSLILQTQTSILQQQTKTLDELKESHKEAHDTLIEMLTIARLGARTRAGGC